MVDYRVQSVQTNFRIGHTGFEKPGARVITDGAPGIPLHHHLIFSAPISPGQGAVVTVKQWNGLYIGLDKRGGRLEWTAEPFAWHVTPSGRYHQFFPLAGGDFYWYQNHQIVPEVGAAAGHDLVPPEPFFEVLPVDA